MCKLTSSSIFNAATSPAKAQSSLSAALYLPSGVAEVFHDDQQALLKSLTSSLSVPVVRINYRLSTEHRYPTPVHDVLAGYDWVVQNLLPKQSIVRTGRSESVGRLAVCGAYVGGSLATALALTECRVNEPGIVAAAVSNPIADWVSLGLERQRKRRSATGKIPPAQLESRSLSLEQLLRLRSQYFGKPAHYFDPFASPMLFFRSAGIATPPLHQEVPVDDFQHLSMLEREASIEGMDTPRSMDDEAIVTSITAQQRRASRRFPSKLSGIRLPSFHISVSAGSVLAAQAEELSKHLQRSFERQNKNLGVDFGTKILTNEEEEEQVNREEEAMVEADRAAADKVKLEISNEPPELTTVKTIGWLKMQSGKM